MNSLLLLWKIELAEFVNLQKTVRKRHPSKLKQDQQMEAQGWMAEVEQLNYVRIMIKCKRHSLFTWRFLEMYFVANSTLETNLEEMHVNICPT